MVLEPAREADFPAIIDLINVAYRGTEDVQSWNVETSFVGGARLTETLLREDLAASPHAHFLVYRDAETNAILGTVWLEPEEDDAWYLGLFSIAPAFQNRRLGRELLGAAEDFAKARGGRSIILGVLNVRETLIEWYKRRGYRPTGATRPYPYGDDRFGKPLRDDFNFVMLAKQI